jgi:hypothetical protein
LVRGRLLVDTNAIAGEWGHSPLPVPARHGDSSGVRGAARLCSVT